MSRLCSRKSLPTWEIEIDYWLAIVTGIKTWFDNTVEEGNASRIQTGIEIYETLQAFKNDFGRPLDK